MGVDFVYFVWAGVCACRCGSMCRVVFVICIFCAIIAFNWGFQCVLAGKAFSVILHFNIFDFLNVCNILCVFRCNI